MGYHDNGIKAELVFDGDKLAIPESMGKPRSDQMIGTKAERLSEVCGRICYDSLGSGRGSKDYHKHIVDVGHGSVWEHFNYVVEFKVDRGGGAYQVMNDICLCAMNRPGVVASIASQNSVRVSLNLRSALEWNRPVPEPRFAFGYGLHIHVGNAISATAFGVAPAIFGIPPSLQPECPFTFSIQDPCAEHEAWISLLISGSRGLSHEQVRHGDYTAISQRSTRYVDESESEWITHPLTAEYLASGSGEAVDSCIAIENTIASSRLVYSGLSSRLQNFIKSRNPNVDSTTARKQARGAARGYLGNALYTEMIFSASVSQWKRMIAQRGTVHADAEIRELYCKVLAELRKSRYGSMFSGYQIAPSPDGIGSVIVPQQTIVPQQNG